MLRKVFVKPLAAVQQVLDSISVSEQSGHRIPEPGQATSHSPIVPVVSMALAFDFRQAASKSWKQTLLQVILEGRF